jgi:hypothetical protein
VVNQIKPGAWSSEYRLSALVAAGSAFGIVVGLSLELVGVAAGRLLMAVGGVVLSVTVAAYGLGRAQVKAAAATIPPVERRSL